MQKREGRSFAPQPTTPFRPDLGRTGRKGATCPSLPLPAVLPSLSSALSRRAALFGAVTVSSALAGSVAVAMVPAGVWANDRRLVAIAAELLDIDTRANALHEDAPEYDALIDRYTSLEAEMAELPADTLVGVLAKARASKIPAVDGCLNGIADSILDDLLRLHAAEVIS